MSARAKLRREKQNTLNKSAEIKVLHLTLVADLREREKCLECTLSVQRTIQNLSKVSMQLFSITQGLHQVLWVQQNVFFRLFT